MIHHVIGWEPEGCYCCIVENQRGTANAVQSQLSFSALLVINGYRVKTLLVLNWQCLCEFVWGKCSGKCCGEGVGMERWIVGGGGGSGEGYAALLWQKEASDKKEISCKRAKCVCHFHWRQWNIMKSYLTYLLAGWVFMHKIWHGRRAHWH